MSVPSPQQLREQAGLQSKGLKLTLPSPADLRIKVGGFAVPSVYTPKTPTPAVAPVSKIPSPDELRKKSAAPETTIFTKKNFDDFLDFSAKVGGAIGSAAGGALKGTGENIKDVITGKLKVAPEDVAGGAGDLVEGTGKLALTLLQEIGAGIFRVGESIKKPVGETLGIKEPETDPEERTIPENLFDRDIRTYQDIFDQDVKPFLAEKGANEGEISAGLPLFIAGGLFFDSPVGAPAKSISKKVLGEFVKANTDEAAEVVIQKYAPNLLVDDEMAAALKASIARSTDPDEITNLLQNAIKRVAERVPARTAAKTGGDDIASIAARATDGEAGTTVIHLPSKNVYAKVNKDVAEVLKNEVDNVRFTADDVVHLSQIERVAGKVDEVPLADLLKLSDNAKQSVSAAIKGSKLADDTAIGAKFAGENTRDVAAKGKHSPIRQVEDVKIPVKSSKTIYRGGTGAKGTYNGKPFTTDTFLIEFEDLPLKVDILREGADAPDIAPVLQRFLNSKNVELPSPSAIGSKFDDGVGAEILRIGDTTLDVKYYNYLASKYPDLKLTQQEGVPTAAIGVYNGDEFMGLVMPTTHSRRALRGERAITANVQQTSVKPATVAPNTPEVAPKPKKVVPESKKGTAPAEQADDLRTALTSPERVAEEAVKTQRRISGTEPDGVRTAAKLGQAKEIPKTPAKAARFATKNDPPFEIPDETRLAWIQRKIQDKFNRLTLIQKKTGVPLSDDLNAYLQQEMFHGRAAERLDKFEASIISTKGQKGSALLERMAKDNISVDEMGEFLHAKHAPARNKRVAEINENIPDGGSGLTNKQAAAVIEKYKKAGKLEQMEAYAKEVYEKITKARMKILEEEHLLKPEAVEKIKGAFDDDTYVPLKLPVEPDFRMRGGAGFDVRGKDVKRLKGSTEANRVNPLIQAIVDYEDAVIKAEKNKVGRSFKKLVERHPDLTNSQGKKIWEIQAQQYAPQYNKFGEVEFVKPVGYKLADNVMEVRDKGQIFHITMHDKPLASAMKNLGSERGIAFFHQINNYLRAVITFYNPEFMITNFERDIQTALINTGGEQGGKAAASVARDVKASLGGIWRETRGLGSKKNLKEGEVDWVKEYQELKETGGRVGWFDYKTVAEKQKEIQRRINTATGKTKLDKAARTWDAVAEWVSDVNESVESGVRLSAYVNAKKAGLSKEQAASLAKNLTVNFNKKGEWGAAANSLYLFANAGIQGTTRMFKALKHKRTRRIVAGIATFAFGVEYMNRQINEEAYDKISDYEKNTNLIFMLPTGSDAPVIDASIGSIEKIPNTDEKYIKLKLPYGYNVFKVLGDVAYDVGVEGEHVGEGLKRLVFAMEESFNPLSSGSAAQFVSPTITDPLVQMYENKNYFGAPIKPEEDPYAPDGKQSDLYFSTVREPSKLFTEFLNGVSGGNEVEAGVLDFSPENVDHIIDFLGGGVGKFIANTVETGTKLAMGELPEAENAPFVRKFVGDVYDEVERGIFYDLVKRGETRLLNEKEIADLKKYGKEAMDEGQIDGKKAKTAITNFLASQNRIHAGRVFEKIKNLETPDERRQVFNEYITKNGLEKRSDGITEELKDVISGYKAKQGGKDERGFIGTVVDGGRGLFIDPENVIKAILTEEKLGKVEGNLVELQRFYGLEYTDEGGSQEKKRSMLQKAGINPTDANMKAYKLEHIVPVKAGGDTSDSNLRVIPTAEHEAYTPIDVAVAAAVQAGKLTRGEAASIMRRLKVEKSINAQQAYEEVKAKAK